MPAVKVLFFINTSLISEDRNVIEFTKDLHLIIFMKLFLTPSYA